MTPRPPTATTHDAATRFRRLACALAAALAAADAGAQPAAGLEAELLAPDAALEHQLGTSVALSGDVAVVGAPYHDGAGIASGTAYVFRRAVAGWTLAARLRAANAAPRDEFGVAVAVDGDTIVVGAWRADPVASRSGAAYVFVKPPGGWAGALKESATLLVADAAVGDELGGAVAVDGDTIVVGAHGRGAGEDAYGAVYVFTRPARGWRGTVRPRARLAAADPEPGDELGWSVAVSGDVVVSASPPHGYGDEGSGTGHVWVKPRGGWRGVLTASATLDDADVDAVDLLGASVAVSGDVVVLGAPYSVSSGAAAFVFVKPARGWSGRVTHAAKLVGSGQNAQGQVAVAVDGDAVLMGLGNGGSANLFLKPARGWRGTLPETLRLEAPDAAAGDRFAGAVALSGGRALIGAPLADERATSSGAAYVFSLPARPVTPRRSP